MNEPTKEEIKAFVEPLLDEFYDPATGLYKIEELAIEASHHFEESLSLDDEPLDKYIKVIEEIT